MNEKVCHRAVSCHPLSWRNTQVWGVFICKLNYKITLLFQVKKKGQGANLKRIFIGNKLRRVIETKLLWTPYTFYEINPGKLSFHGDMTAPHDVRLSAVLSWNVLVTDISQCVRVGCIWCHQYICLSSQMVYHTKHSRQSPVKHADHLYRECAISCLYVCPRARCRPAFITRFPHILFTECYDPDYPVSSPLVMLC